METTYYSEFSQQRADLRKEWNGTRTDWEVCLQEANLKALKVADALNKNIDNFSHAEIMENYNSLYKVNEEKIVFQQENKQVIQEGNHFFTRIIENGECFESGDFNTLERAKQNLDIGPTFEERLSEIKTDCEMFQEIIIDKLDSLVNDICVTDFQRGSKLSFVKDRLNLFINELNEN